MLSTDCCTGYNNNNMGNQNICCAQQMQGGNLLFSLKGSTAVQQPIALTEHQQAFIRSQNSFPNQLKKSTTYKIAKEDLFEGQVDQKGNPMGFGIFKSKNQSSIYFGKFNQTDTQAGKIFYVLPDGSYFEGNLMAQSGIKGIYVQQQHQYHYQGQLQHRPGQQLRYIPHGKGIETKKDLYTFNGTFENGKRTQGKLKWTQKNTDYQYQGHFDQNQLFTGKGILKEKTGTYYGNFVKGKKEGLGKYEHSVGLLYEGDYKQGKKNGRGKLLNSDGTVSYEGDFQDGLPHGTGVAYRQDVSLKTQFVEGISKQSYMVLVQQTNLLNRQSSEI